MQPEYKATNQSQSFDRALSLPHFDEDASLLSARPVVPLDEVNAKTRSKRRMIFGLTMVAAVFVGAIGAMLPLMHSGQDSSGEAEAQLSQPLESSSGASGGSEPNPVETKSQLPTVKEDKPTTVKASKTVEEMDENREADERELRLIERREARRFNREASRQRRYSRQQTGDDLLRIREIFEGAPRP